MLSHSSEVTVDFLNITRQASLSQLRSQNPEPGGSIRERSYLLFLTATGRAKSRAGNLGVCVRRQAIGGKIGEEGGRPWIPTTNTEALSVALLRKWVIPQVYLCSHQCNVPLTNFILPSVTLPEPLHGDVAR
jgi:hypothetical protein